MILTIFIFFAIILLILKPQKYTTAFFSGITVWAKCVLPSILPFMFLSKILVDNGSLDYISRPFSPFVSKIFSAPTASGGILLISSLCGYPIGAKTIADYYESNRIDTTDAYKLTTFCSTASPIFAIGTIGANFLKSYIAGIVIFGSHYLANIIFGLLVRRKYTNKTQNNAVFLRKNSVFLSEIMLSSVTNSLIVGGFIAFFYMLCDMFTAILPTSLSNISWLIIGLSEITNGCYLVANTFSLPIATIISCGLISFGGICVFLQSLVFYRKCDMKGGKILLIKLCQGTLATLVCIPFALLFLQ